MVRKVFAWISTLVAVGLGGLLLYDFIDRPGDFTRWVGGVLPFIFVCLLSAVIAFFLFRSSKGKDDEASRTAGSSVLPASNEPFGSAFDIGTLNRSKIDVYRDRPETLRARVRDIRTWEEKVGWSRLKTQSFHLDYDRNPKDFGDLILVLRSRYFRKFNYREGDKIDIHLRWSSSGEKNAITSILNLESGQKFEPDYISHKAGHLRAQQR